MTRVWTVLLMTLFVVPPLAGAADPPIVRAAAAVNGAVVRSLIKQGADVNVQGSDGATALLWIARTDETLMDPESCRSTRFNPRDGSRRGGTGVGCRESP